MQNYKTRFIILLLITKVFRQFCDHYYQGSCTTALRTTPLRYTANRVYIKYRQQHSQFCWI
jgi:hypothetical protein